MQSKKNSSILFIADVLVICLFFYLVFFFYHKGSIIPLRGIFLMGVIIIYWFIIAVNSNIIKIDPSSNTINILKDTLIAYSVLSTVVIATVAIFGEFRPNDKLVLYPLLFGSISSTILRLINMIVIKKLLKLGYFKKSVLLIGSGNLSRQVIRRILSTPELGYSIHGFLSDSYSECTPKGLYLGKVKRLPEVLHDSKIDEVIIGKPLNDAHSIKCIIDQCEQAGVRFSILPDIFNIIPKWTIHNLLGEIPVMAARNEPLNIFSNRIIKRSFDILVSSVGLFVLSPVLIVIAISVQMTSSGPILFRQKRIGNNNVEFTLIKFRSMTMQSRAESDTIWTTPDDQRVTPLGRILRQTNLDELPQLWNVLVGDMSIVGPRPEREHFVKKFSREIPNYRIRHLVKSGITGLAQANGWRGNTSIQKRIENDLYYLEHWSLWLDLKIIFLTLFNRAAWKNAI
jgi:Undecaprenyl-phosphate glucose phosphotransferase